MAKKILLVEDEALIALNETRILQSHGFEVVTCHRGEESVEAVRGDPDISLVLMDVDLGEGIDGTEAARRILKIRELPVIFLTSHSEKEYVDRVRRITRYGYVLKNSGEFVLRQSIQTAYELFETKMKAQQHLEESLEANREMEFRETRLQHLNRVLLSLRGINHVITRETEEGRILDRACRVMIETSGYHRVWIVRVKDGKPVPPFHHAGFNETFSAMVSYLEQGNIPTCARVAMEEDQQVLVDKPGEECLHCPFCDKNPMNGTDAEASVTMTKALRHGEELYGWISVILPEVYGTNPDEHRLFDEIAGDISYALYSLQLLEEKVAAGQQLQASEGKYRALYHNAPLPYQSLDPQGCFLDVNPAWLNTLGYEREEVIGKNYADFLHPDWKPHFEKNFPAFKKRGYVHDVQFKIRHKNGEYLFITFEGCIGYQPDGSVRQTYCVFKDITDQKKTEERLQKSEAKYRNLVENAPIGIFQTDTAGHALHVNPTMARMVGAEGPEEAVTHFQHLARQLYVHPERRQEFLRRLQKDGFVENFEYEAAQEDGTHRWFSMNARVGRELEPGNFLIEGFTTDVTDQEMTRKKLEQSVVEKDSLMQELNHRVKNNLMMITSLLSLKEAAMGGSADLSDVRHQIEAIRIIHEKLFHSGTVSEIEIESYLRDLVDLIFSNFTEKKVMLKIDIEDFLIKTRAAIPLGLLVNEIATNALKYGFKDHEEQVFSLSLKKGTDELVLILSNTGDPFPEDIELNNPDTLGLQLITTLVEQLNGQVSLRRSPSPQFTIRFPVPS